MMNEVTVKRLILVTILETEVQGMIAENKMREMLDQSLAYDGQSFEHVAGQMRGILNAKDDQIMNDEYREFNSSRTMPLSPDFKASRKAKGLTLRQVEAITGLSNAYLSQLETGKIKKPSYEVVKTLYNLYNNT